MDRALYFLNNTNAGIDHRLTDKTQAIIEPIMIPLLGIDHITIKEYTATLAPPSIIGAAAP